VFSLVRVPSVAQEDAKRTYRERMRLINERNQHTNRIKGLLATQGIYDFEPMKRDRLERLESLRGATGQPLPARFKREITRHLRRRCLILEMIAEVEAKRDAVVDAPAAAGEEQRKIRQLARLRAIGPEMATGLVNEVLYRRFENRRQVAAYVGLSPSPFNSGDMVRHQGISKAGNRWARTLMIELAWLWVRYQPHSALSHWFVEQVNGGKGRIKRIAIVALARKLLVALWRYLETGLVPSGAELKS
jgi:transposase